MPDQRFSRACFARLRPLGRRLADASYLLLATTIWLASSVIGALGLLLGFVIIGADARPLRFFAHIQNLSTHYLFADPTSRARFDGQLLMVFLAVTGLLMIARLPAFVLRVRRELAREASVAERLQILSSRTVAGWPITRVLVALALLATLVWAAWATRVLLELRSHRVVSVSLSRLVEDFVAAEARNTGSPEDASKRTSAYLAVINRSIGDLSRAGDIVLVSEATLGRSVPDRTEQIRGAVAREMEAGRGQH